MAKLASLSYWHVRHSKTNQKAIYVTLKNLDQLENWFLERMAPSASPTANQPQSNDYDIAEWQKHILSISIRSFTLNLCRVTLGPSLLSTETRHDIYTCAMQVALQIVEIRKAKVPRLFEVIWFVTLKTLL